LFSFLQTLLTFSGYPDISFFFLFAISGSFPHPFFSLFVRRRQLPPAPNSFLCDGPSRHSFFSLGLVNATPPRYTPCLKLAIPVLFVSFARTEAKPPGSLQFLHQHFTTRPVLLGVSPITVCFFSSHGCHCFSSSRPLYLR